MLKWLVSVGAGMRCRLPRSRNLGAFALTAACMGLVVAMGPLAAIAVGSRDHSPGGGSGGGGLRTGTTNTSTTTTPSTTTTTPSRGAPAPKVISVPAHNPFANRAMWIWEMPYTSGGNVAQIITSAKRYGIKLLLIKSGDGTGSWSQFSPTLVHELHAAGLKVCGWQYVYGYSPVSEARVGIRTVKDGADCLVIDAESEYEGHYVRAQTYITHLRAGIGKNFPVALAGFPWVDYHPSFPYSVFLGRGGAQYNVPQMYWKDIGTSVATVFAHTYEWNEIYRRPIYPLGQMFSRPPLPQIARFNALAGAYGSRGVSWWDWQSATKSDFASVTKVESLPGRLTLNRAAASISRGYTGDYVIWAQEYLAGWASRHETGKLRKLPINGDFDALTQAEVRAYQARHQLPVTGVIDGYTWDKLLAGARPVSVRWVWRKHRTVAQASRLRAAAASGRGTETIVVPKLSRRRIGRNELHGEPGRGGRG